MYHPEVLVTTEWVAEHLNDPRIRIVESNEDILLYDMGHIPGAVQIDWQKDLNDAVRRDYLTREQFEALMSANGIANDTTVVFYGDKNNWWACYAFWVFQLFGHDNAKVMDGGRAKWEADGRPMVKEMPSYPASGLQAQARADYKIRAYRDQVLAHVQAGHAAGRCALARRVQRRAAAHAQLPAGRRAARRPHPRRDERSLGAGGQRRRHLQVSRRAARDLRSGAGPASRTTTSWPTAASASAPATPGSC